MKTSYTASIVVPSMDGRKVLCMLHPKYDRWVFPGGHIEQGEAPHEAALRELREEVALSVELIDWTNLPSLRRGANARLPHPIAVVEEDPTGRADGTERYVDFVFVARADSEAERLIEPKQGLSWLTADELLNVASAYPTAELAAAVLARAKQGR